MVGISYTQRESSKVHGWNNEEGQHPRVSDAALFLHVLVLIQKDAPATWASAWSAC